MWLAALTSFALVAALALVGAFGGVASAGPSSVSENGVTASVVLNGSTYNGTDVVAAGDTETLNVEYAAPAAGKTVTLTVSDNAKFTFDPDALKSNNPAIASVTIGSDGSGTDNTVTIVFVNDFGTTHSGVFGMTFTMTDVTQSEETTLAWGFDDQSATPITLIVMPPDGDTTNPGFAPTSDSFSKTASPTTVDLGGYITYDGTTATVAGLDSDPITYTLNLTVATSKDIAIADVLKDNLILDSSSFTCTVTKEWDSNGLNVLGSPEPCTFTPSASTDTSFSGTLAALTGPANVTITYKAHLDDTAVQSSVESWLSSHGGTAAATYTDTATNGVTFNGSNETSAPVTLSWEKAGYTPPSTAKAVTAKSGFSGCAKPNSDGSAVDASSCAGATATYTLTYYGNANDAQDITFADNLPAGMEFVGAPTATQTTWGATYPYTKSGPTSVSFSGGPTVTGTATDAAGQSFTGTINAPVGPVAIVVTYQAKIAVVSTNLQSALNTAYDATKANNAAQTFTAPLTNSATIGSGTYSKAVDVTGTRPGLNTANAFGKSAGWTAQQVVGDASGALTADVPIAYTLKANLTALPSYATTNVVIADTLPATMTWGGAPAVASGSTGLTLTQADESVTCTASDPAAFGGASTVGNYCISGQTLLINVGHDNATNAVITASAIITSVSGTGTPVGNPAYPQDTHQFVFTNTANFYYGGASPTAEQATSTLSVLPIAGDDGYNVPNVFTKTSNTTGEIHVNSGSTATIKYTFTIAANQGINVAKSTITDYVDNSIFTLPDDLDSVISTATYKGSPLAASDFTVTQDSDGNLVISPNDGVITDDGSGSLVLTISLTTKAFDGPETMQIVNKAVLSGSESQLRYWSSAQSNATSYGDESQVLKTVYDAHAGNDVSPWAASVDSLVTSSGGFVDNPFVYQLQFIAHGQYGVTSAVHPGDVVDSLPAGLEFVGFIDPQDPNSITTTELQQAVDSPDTASQNLGDGVSASFAVGDPGTVTIAFTGNTLSRSVNSSGYYTVDFVVRATNTGEPIVNSVGGSSATIQPVYGSASWEKTNGSGQTLIGGSEWTLTGPDGAVSVVDNGSGDEDSATGKLQVGSLVAGDYTLVETKAPAGYVLNGTPHAFTIDAQHLAVDLGAIANSAVPIPPGGGVETPVTSTTPTSPSTTTTSPTTSTTRPPSTATINPSSATSPTRPVPPPNQPPVTTTVPAPDQCAALVETGFRPGETVTVRVTGPDGQYEMSAIADASGTVHLCVNADHPQTVTIEVLGENRHTVREVTIGVLGTEGSLPNTGFATLRYVGWALLLLATGGALVFGAKRRDRGARHV